MIGLLVAVHAALALECAEIRKMEQIGVEAHAIASVIAPCSLTPDAVDCLVAGGSTEPVVTAARESIAKCATPSSTPATATAAPAAPAPGPTARAASKSEVVTLAEMRERDGSCVKFRLSAILHIESCFVIGMPGTVHDDGKTPLLVSVISGPDLDLAKPSAYQLEVERNGQPALKAMGADEVPNVPSGDRDWWAIDIQELPEAPRVGDTFTLTWTAAWDTKRTETIAVVVR
jgi:hypothetical protein